MALVVLRAFGLLLLPWWLLGAAALAVALLLFVGLYLPRSGIFARPLTRVVGVADVLALTFDDGPDPEATPRVLEVLTQRGHRATFFMIGARVAAAPAVVRQVVAAGCTVGNHAYHHSWLTPFFGARRLARELTRTQEAVVAAAGEEARPRFMRPPVGLMGPFVEPAAARVGLRLCAFSTRAGDASLWPLGARRVVARVRRGLRAGAIVALHDGVEVTGRVPLAPAVLHEILDAVEAAGLRSVTLEELAGVDHGDARGAGRR